MRLLVVCLAAFGLAACDWSKPAPTEPSPTGEPDYLATPPDPALSAVAENVDPTTAEIPPPVEQEEAILTGLANGGSATLRLDCAPGSEVDALLGTLMCGEDYTLYYETPTSRWIAIGPDRGLVGSGAQMTLAGAKNPGPHPSSGKVVAWGAPFSIDAENLASLGNGQVVGRLVYSTE